MQQQQVHAQFPPSGRSAGIANTSTRAQDRNGWQPSPIDASELRMLFLLQKSTKASTEIIIKSTITTLAANGCFSNL